MKPVLENIFGYYCDSMDSQLDSYFKNPLSRRLFETKVFRPQLMPTARASQMIRDQIIEEFAHGTNQIQ